MADLITMGSDVVSDPPDWLLEGAGELPPEVLGRLQEDSRVKQSAALSARAIHFFIFIVFSSHSFTWWMYFLFTAVP